MKIRKMLPIICIEIYLIITVLLYQFGPIEYYKQNQFQLYSFIIIFQLVFFIGYYLSEKYIIINEKNIVEKIKSEYEKKFNLIMTIIICISLFFSLMVIVRYANTWNPIEVIQTIINSLFNPDKAYADRLIQSQDVLIGGRYITTISTGLSFLFYLAIPIGIYHFKKLKKHNKILLIICIISEVLSFLIKGTNFGIFRVAIIIITIILIKICENKTFKKINKKKAIKVGLIILTLILVVLGYFMYSTTSRMGGNDNIPKTISGANINQENFLLKIVPRGLRFGTILAISYVSQGYNGMALAFNYDFSSTYGIGNSDFLIENFKDILGIDIYSNTYQFKMQEEWHPTINWHTAYTWFANDVSFWGVIAIMFVLGIALNLILRDAQKGNTLAISLLPLYIIMIIFLPCNNVVLSNPSTFMPFVIWNIVWLLSKNYNIKIKEQKNERY